MGPRPRWAGGAVDPAMRGLVEACWVRHPTEWGGEESVVPPARDGQEARWTPLCGVLLRHVGLDTPRSGVERIMWSPRPRWAGGAVDAAMRGLVDGGMLGTAAGAAVFRWGCRQDSWYPVP